MTPAALWLCCAACVLITAGCIWQAARSDRARDARAVVAGAEALCRAAAADPYHLHPEETEQP